MLVIEKFPFHDEIYDFDCGHTSLLSVAEYWTRKPVDRTCLFSLGEHVENRMQSTEHSGKKTIEEGLSPEGIIRCAKHFGLTGELINNSSFQNILYFLKQGVPVICGCVVQVPNDEHYTDNIAIDPNGKRINGQVLFDSKGRRLLADPKLAKKSEIRLFATHYLVTIGYNQKREEVIVSDPNRFDPYVHLPSKDFEWSRRINPHISGLIIPLWPKGYELNKKPH